MPLGEGALAAALETVLYAQMLVLFAPAAVPTSKHVQVLVGTLSTSRQPRLRKAAADTLRHLAERDAHSVAAQRPEQELFAALDRETGAWAVCVWRMRVPWVAGWMRGAA
jgi:hypothetical protein